MEKILMNDSIRKIILTFCLIFLLIISMIIPIGTGYITCKKTYSKEQTPNTTESPLQVNNHQSMIWPMSKNDAQHTGKSIYDTSNNTGIEKWTYYDGTNRLYLFTPLIDSNGTLYIANYDTIMALNPTGTLKWKWKVLGYETIYTLGLGPDGMIYIGSSKRIYAICPNNTIKWILTMNQTFCSLITFSADSTIYVGTTDGTLYAVNPNGSIKWGYYIGSWVIGVSLDHAENIYVTARYDNNLYCLNPNGTLRWTFFSIQGYYDCPLITEDGTIYLPSSDTLYAINPDGTEKWQVPIEGGSSPLLAPDGTLIYSPIWSTKIYALDPMDGRTLWAYNVAEKIEDKTSAVIGDDGTIYCPYIIENNYNFYGYMCALTSNGELKWRTPFSTNPSQNYMYLCANPSIGADGTVYVTEWFDDEDKDGSCVHAFSSGPLGADAGGPYFGIYMEETSFYSSVFGGLPSYTYQWDFGDGTNSKEFSPTHVYTQIGNYTAMFTVTDSNGTVYTDAAEVTIIYTPPIVKITRPVEGTYFLDIKILNFPLFFIWFFPGYIPTTIIGKILVKAEAVQNDVGIMHVEFYIDGELKHIDTTPPYEWLWRKHFIELGEYTLSAVVVDNLGRKNFNDIPVLKIL